MVLAVWRTLLKSVQTCGYLNISRRKRESLCFQTVLSNLQLIFCVFELAMCTDSVYVCVYVCVCVLKLHS